jgi:hypothetical protein
METTEYGVPIYLTLNASNADENINKIVQDSIHHANQHKSTLYVVVNSGKPTIPPPTPPGGGG